MDSRLYLENYINKLNNFNESQLSKYNIKESSISREKKEINPNNRELRNYNTNRYKSLKNSNLNNDVINIEYDFENTNIDLFDSNNFNLNDINENKEKINFFSLDNEEKKNYINKYILRKKYQIEFLELDKLFSIIDNEEKIKKYINFSTELNQIVRISCLKKKEDGTLYFLEENTKLKKKNIFINKK